MRSIEKSDFPVVAFSLCFTAFLIISCTVSKEGAFAAAQEGDLPALTRFVTADPLNIKAVDDYENTLLSVAITSKRQAAVDFLLSNGADANAPNKGGHTPLHLAAAVDNLEAAQSLLKAGADLQARNVKDRGKTALHYAAINGSLLVADLLLQNGVDVDARCSVKATPLSWAAYLGTLETVKFLISKGADITARDSFGDSILGAAKNGKKTDIYDYLVSIGAK